MTSLEVNIEMPVYKTTTDLAAIQIDQMHVLFESSPDGLETKELYIFSKLPAWQLSWGLALSVLDCGGGAHRRLPALMMR